MDTENTQKHKTQFTTGDAQAHIKGKSNWIKHLDFIALNLLSVIVAFTIVVLLIYIRKRIWLC